MSKKESYLLKPKIKALNEKQKKKVIDDYDIILTSIIANKGNYNCSGNTNSGKHENMGTAPKNKSSTSTCDNSCNTSNPNNITTASVSVSVIPNTNTVNNYKYIYNNAVSKTNNLKFANINLNINSKINTHTGNSNKSPMNKKINNVKSSDDEKNSSNNKVITVDLTSPKKVNREIKSIKANIHSNYRIANNTKIVNLDLSSVNGKSVNSSISSNRNRNVNSFICSKEDKVFDRSKSDKLLFSKANANSNSYDNSNYKIKSALGKKVSNKTYFHIPTVKTSLYSSSKSSFVQTEAKSTEKNVNLQCARSNSKAKNSNTNESLNDMENSDESLCYSENNVNFNFNSIKMKLDDIKLNIKKLDEKRNMRSVSPIKINYSNLKDFSLSKKNNEENLTEDEEENVDIKLKVNTQDFNIKVMNPGLKENLKVNYPNIGKNNIRFLNLIRMKMKKESEIKN